MKGLFDEYTPELVRKVGDMAKRVGGHGMDFLMAWRLVDCLRNGLPLDQDVYAFGQRIRQPDQPVR